MGNTNGSLHMFYCSAKISKSGHLKKSSLKFKADVNVFCAKNGPPKITTFHTVFLNS